MLKAFLACAFLGLAPFATSATQLANAGTQSIPPVPQYYLLDEADLLTPQQEKALATILIEHDRATDEQIVIATFRQLPDDENAIERTRRLFDEWRIGKRGRDNGALMALYAGDETAHLQAGYGLSAIDEEIGRRIVSDFLRPELRAGHPYRALSLSLIEVLRTIESPLIETGRAQQLVQEGGLHGSLKPLARSGGPASWLAFVLVGLVLFGGVLNNILSADAHFTGEGWFRPNPWKLSHLKERISRRRQAPATSAGGIDGSW